MPKYALVHKDEKRVHEVAADAAGCFDVHEDFTWIPCPDDCAKQWDYDKETGTFIPEKKAQTTYSVVRRIGYGDVGAQLDSIFWALSGGDNTGLEAWAERQRLIKALVPKNNPDAVEAVNDEIRRRMNIEFDAGRDPDAGAITYQLALDYDAGNWVNPAL